MTRPYTYRYSRDRTQTQRAWCQVCRMPLAAAEWPGPRTRLCVCAQPDHAELARLTWSPILAMADVLWPGRTPEERLILSMDLWLDGDFSADDADAPPRTPRRGAGARR